MQVAPEPAKTPGFCCKILAALARPNTHFWLYYCGATTVLLWPATALQIPRLGEAGKALDYMMNSRRLSNARRGPGMERRRPKRRPPARRKRPAQAGTLKERRALLPKKPRSEEHTSELQSLMRISYAVFCLHKKNKKKDQK